MEIFSLSIIHKNLKTNHKSIESEIKFHSNDRFIMSYVTDRSIVHTHTHSMVDLLSEII